MAPNAGRPLRVEKGLMKRLLVLAAVVAGCSSSDERPILDLYDRLDFLCAQYNAALDRRDAVDQVRAEGAITREAQKGFDVLTRDAGGAVDIRRRWLATFALGFSKRPDADTPLRARLDDPDPLVRVAAAISLAVLGSPNPPIERVKLMLGEPAKDVRVGALVALKIMLTPGEDAGLSPYLIGLLDDRELAVRLEAINVMARVRRLEFLAPLMRKGLLDDHWFVRMNSAMAVGAYGPEGDVAIPILIDLLRDKEAAVVEATHWALKKISGKDFDRTSPAWQEWWADEQAKWEYACATDKDIVTSTPGECPTCGARLERRAKPIRPKRDEKKDEKK